MSLNRSVVRVWWWRCAGAWRRWPARPARAFCGFFVAGSDAKLTNNASQVVLMRKGNRTVMTMSEHVPGTARETSRWSCRCRSCCRRRTSRRCPPTCSTRSTRCRRRGWSNTGSRTPAAADAAAHGGRRRRTMAMRRRRPRRRRKRARDLGVKVEARFVTGEYEVVILSAKGLVGAGDLAAPGEVQHPAGRGGGAGALHPRQVEVLRRQGRHQEGAARRAGRRAAVAAALLLRRQRAAPAGAPRAC